MPTGYTDPVRSGEITTLKEFGLLCARAFGATILMRDEPLDKPIPVFEPSDYHLKAKERAEARLVELRTKTDTELEAEIAADYEARCESRNRYLNRATIERARYEAMLVQVETLEVPESHAEFKNYMRSQLTESIEHDCDSSYYRDPPKTYTVEEWRSQQIESAQWDVDYHEKGYAEEVERVRGRNEWIATLRTILAQGEASPALTE